jgi:hypothetical protein
MQNEFFALLAKEVSNGIVSKTEKQNIIHCFCIAYRSYRKQIIQTVRYMKIENGLVSVEESFRDFFLNQAE